ncbi:MAG: hypothetical protein SO533_01950 [Eubacteriales bacterium]|nr:hypothetical protein [Clostridiales bacterium]MDD7594626.1 hypothetical protein [Clostridiales bacterium]MDY4886388.1 hypothetical protein [Eubacteriales bacterium]
MKDSGGASSPGIAAPLDSLYHKTAWLARFISLATDKAAASPGTFFLRLNKNLIYLHIDF